MYRTLTRSRPALMLRRVRGRFGMQAPRMTVRAHIPWYWRALVTVLLLAAAIVMATWVYDIGRRFAGYDKSMADQESGVLRERVAALEIEVEHFRNGGVANLGSAASIQIEQTSQQKLAEQIKRLEIENGRLREDVAAFENLASGETKNETVSINRFQVEPDPTTLGAYRYRALISAPVSHPEFKGRLQLAATLEQDGKTVMVNIADAADVDPQKSIFGFKYFRRIESNFTLPARTVLKKLEIRLTQGGTVVASQQVLM